MPRLLNIVLAALLSSVATAQSDTASASVTLPSTAGQTPASLPVPFGVGEKLVYGARYGILNVGEGSMEVVGVENIRGRDAWHTRFRLRGGVLFYRVDDLLESWFDTSSMASLRFWQDYDQGGRSRERRYDIFPDRQTYHLQGQPEEQPSVVDPLDEGSFFYFVRTLDLEVGRTYTFERYYRPDRNPVVLKVLRKERITVPAGTYETIVVQPILKTRGIFQEGGEAFVWLSDDDDRIIVQMRGKVSFGTLSLQLKSHRPPTDPVP